MGDLDLRIRRASGLDDYLACVAIQKEVWDYSAPEDIAAQAILMIGNRFGGSLLIAETSGGQAIGFSFAMAAWKKDKRLFWWSHMTAVANGYRNREIGLALKLRQRDEALSEGIDRIEWTFDPMQAMNAHFNIAKLGVIVREYEENVYGDTSSPLHSGLPTDRFVAEWHLNSERVRQRTDTKDRAVILRDIDRMHRIGDDLDIKDSPLILEIPVDVGSLKSMDLELARRWQQRVRTACLRLFQQGYAVTDFIRMGQPADRAFYVLELPASSEDHFSR